MIQVCSLTKSFGTRVALAGVNLAVAAGECVALVGPNGAGKTTLLRVLATLTRPTSGSVRIAGLDAARVGSAVRRKIGFLSHRTLLYDDLTAEQNLRFYARLYSVEDASARIAELLERVGLNARRHEAVRAFSRGMQQRLALARIVLHRPQVLLLDEPYTGLDTAAVQMLTGMLAELAGQGRAILLTTHDPQQILAAVERVATLERGRIIRDERSAIRD